MRKNLDGRTVKDFSIEAVKKTGCHGFCEQGPLVVIEPQGTFYTKVKPKDVDNIIAKSIESNDVINELLFTNPKDKQKIERYHDVPFFSHQRRIALRNLGKIAPFDIREYIAVDGYKALAKVLTTMSPDQVIDEISKSELRGRGGGGFPAGKKWRTCRNVKSDTHYVICNGDEGDPGAFMDRSIMEGDPHSVLGRHDDLRLRGRRQTGLHLCS